MAAGPGDPRRRFATAWAGGAAVAALAFFWMVTEGTADLLRYQRVNSDFYEAQARALLHGELAIPARTLGLEAFSHGGRTYTYFPPVPALMRLPFVAVTHSLDGRLATLFTFVAFLVALAGSGMLAWRIRSVARADHPLGRAEAAGVAFLALLVGMGSPLFFPASRPWVYHEAAIWGMAFAVCAYDQVIAFVRAPSRGRLTRAALFGAGALLSRPPIGAGVFATLTLVLVVAAVARWRPTWAGVAGRLGLAEPVVRNRGWLGGLAAAVAIPAAVYVAINLAKFGTPLNVPYDAQLQNLLDPHRRAVLAANGGSLFTLRAVPTQVLQLLRPDGLRLHATFPFVGAPTTRPSVVGSLRFDQLDFTASLTAAAPALVILAVVGIVRVLRSGGGPLRLPVLGAAVVLPVSWSFLYVAQRYASDVLPLLLLLALTGFWATVGWLDHRSAWARRAVVAGFAVVVAVGAWTGFALALEYQRNLAPLVPDGLRHQYVAWQWDVADALGVGHPGVRRVDRLGPVGPRDSLAVLGDCDAVYGSDGNEWRAVERTAAAGHFRLGVRFPETERGTRQPLVVVGDGPDRWTIEVQSLGAGRAVLAIPGRPAQGTAFSFTPGSESVLDVVMDPQLGELRVVRNGRVLLGAGYENTVTGPTPVTFGADPGDPAARFEGRIRDLPVQPTFCRSLSAGG